MVVVYVTSNNFVGAYFCPSHLLSNDISPFHPTPPPPPAPLAAAAAAQPTGEYRDEGDFPIQTRALLPVAFPRGSTSSTTASPSGAAAAGSGASGSAEAEAVLVDRNAAMRNLFCMMSCALPVGTATPLKRLAAVNKTTVRAAAAAFSNTH